MTVEEILEETKQRKYGPTATMISDNETWLSFADEAEELGLHFPSQEPLSNYFERFGISFPVAIIFDRNKYITYIDDTPDLTDFQVVDYTPRDTTPFHSDDLSSILNL